MKFYIPSYKGEHSIISLALDETTKEDLLKEEVSCWYIDTDKVISFPDNTIVTQDVNVLNRFSACNNYDVFEISDTGNAFRCYDSCSVENTFFITGKCNSNCIICPSPIFSRKQGETSVIDNLINIASHMPSDAPHITITGGEPFMAGKDIFRLLDYCKNKFEQTEFQILTNGRVFAIKEYCDMLADTIPAHSILGIPIHGSSANIHDLITQTKGSFRQSIKGMKRLQQMGIATELRIVVCRENAEDMVNMAKLIVDELRYVDHISIMAMEMTGSAYKNRNTVWIPYKEAFQFVKPAAELLINNGIDVRLYNFPLCVVEKDYWTICIKSISSWKIQYDDCCDTCIMKSSCGGVFSGSFTLVRNELSSIS